MNATQLHNGAPAQQPGLLPTQAGASAQAQQTVEKIVHEVDETHSWGNEHMRTRATLRIEYVYTEDEDGNISGGPSRAFIVGETTTWTDNAFVGFHGTTQVVLEPVAFQTALYRFGVDGTVIPSPTGSRRTDAWQEEVPLGTAQADRSSRGGRMKVNFWHN
jgi:hypothetical protein